MRLVVNHEILKSPFFGKVHEVHVKVGDTVKPEQLLVSIDSGICINIFPAGYDGVVEEILVKTADEIEWNQPLLTVSPL